MSSNRHWWRMSPVRMLLVAVPLGIGIGFTLALVWLDSFVISLLRIVCLIGSVFAFAAMILAIAWTINVLRKEREGGKFFVLLVAFSLELVVSIALIAVVTNDLLVGPLLRELLRLDWLPEGNLLVAGGKFGWLYLTCVTIALVAFFWPLLKRLYTGYRYGSDDTLKGDPATSRVTADVHLTEPVQHAPKQHSEV